MKMNMEQKQLPLLTPQMLQSMKILEMNGQELQDYAAEQTLENPMLELEERRGRPEGEALRSRLQWLRQGDAQNRRYYSEDEERDSLENQAEDPGQTLTEFLLDQLRAMALKPEEERAVEYLIYCLDDKGWLTEKVEILAASSGFSQEELRAAREILRRLEPAGVAAKDLSDCLCLQLLRQEEPDEIALAICRQGLELLAKKRFDLLEKKLHKPREEILRACRVIQSLEPIPSNGFAAGERTVYVQPDLILEPGPAGDSLRLNENSVPHLTVSDSYLQLLEQDPGSETEQYIRRQLDRAHFVLRSIEQRKTTLLACGEVIVRRQAAFFRQGKSGLRPLTLADLAGELGVHESTVSRAIQGKYLQCPRGVFPLSMFFSRDLSRGQGGEEGAFTAEAAKALIQKLIEEEDPAKPLSDQSLCARLKEAGCAISRRTVAKYREELGIGSSAARKQR